MRTMIDTGRHGLELSLSMSCEPALWRRTARWRRLAAALIFAATASPMAAQRASAASAGDNEIRIGSTQPYSGPASAYGVIGKVIAAYFDLVNAEGGIIGRRIKFISYDDG